MAAKSGFAIAGNGAASQIYIDPKGRDHEGLDLVARSFANDVEMVAGIMPEVVTDAGRLNGTVLIAGSIGNNDLIDSLIAKGRIDISALKDKWETFLIRVVENPVPGVEKAVVVVGSDKRGAVYGIFHISELIGVSPWVYWGDVAPKKTPVINISESDLNYTSKEPSVKYRGIFLNDEWPSLGSWVMNKFGDFNEEFYDKVFILILRLKGNFMWPAMWRAIFSEDGKSCNIANAKLADAYGIVMGTSHHEPLFRSGEEWQKIYKNYGISNEWSFSHNGKAITRFWENGVKRNRDFESLITLGMRGERDSVLGGSIRENIDLLKSIIVTQKELLKKHGLADVPQVLTIYKEVEKFWYGTDEAAGLREWDVLDDVTIMLAEDNFGNTRTLPTEAERNREAGWGMYYHFDYHGGPVSYEWINTTPIEKVWEQMSMVYDYGVRNVWVVNVGDLKPQELPISYFLDLAYDFEKWGTDGINKTKEYTRKWTEQQFGNAADKDALDGIAKLLSDYTRLNGKRRPEVLSAETYSCINHNEACRVLQQAIELENAAKKYYDMMPAEYRDAYYQLVYYPAAASANIVKMQIYAGFNKRYYKLGSVLANRYAVLVEDAIQADEEMQSYYNDVMSSGKWQGIMSSAHIGYVNWNAEGWHYPEISYIKPVTGASMVVDVEGTEKGYTSGKAKLPVFTDLLKESHSITVSNKGNTGFDYTAEAEADWIRLNKCRGHVRNAKTIKVSIDWASVGKSSKGIITIKGAGRTVKVAVTAELADTGKLPEMTFVGKENVISIEAGHFFNRGDKSEAAWKVIENYGRSLSSVKMYPTTVSFKKVEDGPYLDYRVFVGTEAEYTLTAYFAPSNNLSKSSRLRYGISFDGAAPVIADSLPGDFVAGDYNNYPWCKGVLDNIHIAATSYKLTKGLHVLRFHGLDAGLVLQKLVLSKDPLLVSYFGPEESYYTKSL